MQQTVITHVRVFKFKTTLYYPAHMYIGPTKNVTCSKLAVSNKYIMIKRKQKNIINVSQPMQWKGSKRTG